MTKNKKNKNKSKAALAVVEKRRKEKLIKESYLAFPVQSRYYESEPDCFGQILLTMLAMPSTPIYEGQTLMDAFAVCTSTTNFTKISME